MNGIKQEKGKEKRNKGTKKEKRKKGLWLARERGEKGGGGGGDNVFYKVFLNGLCYKTTRSSRLGSVPTFPPLPPPPPFSLLHTYIYIHMYG